MIKGVKPLTDDLVKFPQAEKLLIADSGKNEDGYFPHRPLDGRLVLGGANPCGHNRRAVVLRQFLIAFVENQLGARVLDDEQYYSVPFEFIKRKVDVRLTPGVVEIFFEGSRVCSHVRLYGRKGQYSTQEAHMPPNHQQYVKWDGDRFRKWAAKSGENTVNVVTAILASHKVEQQGYRACMALLRNPEYPDAESGVIRTQNPELSGQRIRSYPDRESGVIRTEVEPHKQTNFSKQLLPKQAGVVRRSRNTSKGTG